MSFGKGLIIGVISSTIASIIIIFAYDIRFCSPSPTAAEMIEKLTRQAYRWYIASKQDEHPLVKILHANYAVGYVDALRTIAPDETVDKITKLHISKLADAASAEQDKALVMLASGCPELIPDDPVYREYLMRFLYSQQLNLKSI